ncbi:CFI-box-CTERM domain-containing protein [Flavobacterium sp.]|uniref:CFI-box-CTERM domain-containing protein n=3 Tax=Flavobacterium sp. TaxID=239 RepID=UPI004048AF6F
MNQNTKGKFEYILALKIFENACIFIENSNISTYKYSRSAVITATTLSASISLNLLFPNKNYENFDLDYLIEHINIFIQDYNKSVELEIVTENIFDDDFFLKQTNLSQVYWQRNDDFKKLIIKDIEEFGNELTLNKSMSILNLNNSKKGTSTFFCYNIYISLFIYPLINGTENSKERINLIKEKLKENNFFLNSKNNFTIFLNNNIAIITSKHSEPEFIDAIKSFKKPINQKTKNSNPNCYIATLAYGDINHPNVELFRNFRDNKLRKTISGKIFIKIYYLISPQTVKILKPFNKINSLIKKVLDFIIIKIS